MITRTKTLRMAVVETAAEGLGRDTGPAELTEHDRWLLRALSDPGSEGEEPPPDPPDADPELTELLLAALEGEGRPEAVPERALPRAKAGILLRDR